MGKLFLILFILLNVTNVVANGFTKESQGMPVKIVLTDRSVKPSGRSPIQSVSGYLCDSQVCIMSNNYSGIITVNVSNDEGDFLYHESFSIVPETVKLLSVNLVEGGYSIVIHLETTEYEGRFFVD